MSTIGHKRIKMSGKIHGAQDWSAEKKRNWNMKRNKKWIKKTDSIAMSISYINSSTNDAKDESFSC